MEKIMEGVVIETRGQTAKVRISKHNDCENCGACAGSSALVLDAVDELKVQAGQRVYVKVKERSTLLAAFTVYILPLLVIGLGIMIGYFLSLKLMVSSELLMVLGGIAFGLAAVYILRRLDKSFFEEEEPIIVKGSEQSHQGEV